MAEQTLTVLRCRVLAIKYRDPNEGLWSSVLMESPDEPGPFTAVGEFISIREGDEFILSGQWTTHPKYGRQFEVVYAKLELPTTPEGIKRYLSGGLFKGIGPKLASRIVEHFGTDTLRILEEEPERLREVKGISEKKYARLVKGLTEYQALHDLALFLQGNGVSLSLVRRIFEHYGTDAIEVVRENPYRLIREVPGIGFILADSIALKIGVAPNSPHRIRAAILHVLDEACQARGHVYLPESQLLESCLTFLRKNAKDTPIEPEQVSGAIAELIASGDLVRSGDDAIYTRLNYNTEVKLARLLRQIARTRMRFTFDLDELIAETERKLGKKYAPEQKEAIRTALTSPVSVLTGGPGTGKSTVVHGVITVLKQIKPNARVLLAAPTGKAAMRLEEITGLEAKTIHRLLEYSFEVGGFQRNEEHPLEADLIVVDEVSMIDLYLAVAFMRAVRPGTRVLLVGDPDQLPPVGIGNFLNDLIRSGIVPVVRLRKIFRQENAAESRIVLNAHAINSGRMPNLSPARDFYFKEIEDYQDIADYVVEAVRSRMDRYGPDQLTVLTPMRKGSCGVLELNARLQEVLNPRAPGKDEIVIEGQIFRVGDRVMQTSNNYKYEVFNGETGIIVAINRVREAEGEEDDDEREEDEIVVQFDGRRVAFPLSEATGLTLAYAMTVHKSQGSEFPGVTIVICSMQHYPMLQRNLLYTAITRAKDHCLLVGQKRAIWRCVSNKGSQERYTKLVERLQSEIE